ncbi:MAG: type VI secretion system baseplate subunit TssG [Bryobacterales bacterium]|nr:type VI secretion system baseplate subunit TssG [Bryobacterales bacterium]
MATAGGPQDPHVEQEGRPSNHLAKVEARLREDPTRFEFFQAVRLLDRIFAFRETPGRFAHPDQEAVRFKAHNSIPFPASQIQQVEWPEGEPPRMTVNFMGLTGPAGVLPLAFTEFLIDRIRSKDRSMAEFFDVFNHRLISLFYQAWEKYRFPLAYERGADDAFTAALRALIGIGTPGLENRQQVPDEALLFYTGLLGPLPRSAEALRGMLADYFGVPVEVEQFVGAWYPLGQEDQCQFDSGNVMSESLGLGAVAGDEVWDPQARVRVVIGPLTREEYLRFLPTGSAYPKLCALTRFFSDETEFEAQLVLKREEVPPCGLGAEDADAPLLGWVTWMKSTPEFGRDPGDTIVPLR